MPVSVSEINVGTVEDLITTTGTIRATEVVSLSVQTEGILQISEADQGRLQEGDAVKAGDMIAQITGEDVRLATRMQAAEKQLIAARSNLQATATLVEKNAASDAELKKAKVTYEEAKLEMERALQTDKNSHLISPIDGVILQLARDKNGQPLANGQRVALNETIAVVAAVDTLIADVNLVGRDISRVRVGQQARGYYIAWDNKVFDGKVLRLAPTVDRYTRTIKAEVALDNSEGLLKPGMFMQVTLVGERRDNVPVIPRQALTSRGGRDVVFILRGQRVQQAEVALGLGDADQMPVKIIGF
ncbi:MAG: efflux RND transporter periplasmic adaptor subunit [Exilibacterium sp.]